MKFENLENPSSELDLFVEMSMEVETARRERDEAIILLRSMLEMADDAGMIEEDATINSREFLISVGAIQSDE